MIAQVTAAALVAENRMVAHPCVIDTVPTSANQEDHVSMATHGARRLLDMAENTATVVGIELLAAAQGLDFHRPLTSSPDLEQVWSIVREAAEPYAFDKYFTPDIERATATVRAGRYRVFAADPAAVGVTRRARDLSVLQNPEALSLTSPFALKRMERTDRRASVDQEGAARFGPEVSRTPVSAATLSPPASPPPDRCAICLPHRLGGAMGRVSHPYVQI